MELINDQKMLTQVVEQSIGIIKSDDFKPLEVCQGSGTRTLILREDGNIDMKHISDDMEDLNRLEPGDLDNSLSSSNHINEVYKNIHQSTQFSSEQNLRNDHIEHFLISGSPKSELLEGSVMEEESGDLEDDETIATFVTATGQQLALYAVEDSDEIFAVAVYDESGAPPSNFQFLLKSDVERLIGEGAVKTVKKPSQFKKQIVDADTSLLLEEKKPDIQSSPIKSDDSFMSIPPTTQIKPSNDTNEIMNCSNANNCILNSYEDKDFQFSNADSTNATLTRNDMKEEYLDSSFEDDESECEVIEKSTVQYILCESDQSDSELTFDDIQASLKSFNECKLKDVMKTPEKKLPLSASKAQSQSPQKAPVIDLQAPSSPSPPSPRKLTCTNEEGINQKSVLSQNIKTEIFDVISKEEYISDEESYLPNETAPAEEQLKEKTPPPSVPVQLKVKRSRKQQLTMVNRSDTEIIIQPAVIVNEEEVIIKRRGRRKKKSLPDPDYSPRRTYRKFKRSQRNPVEVIEIDVDEEDTSRKIIEEITIDDKKGSSDKENDIIMVGDSDDEQELLQCEICSRTFRQRRTLDTHARLCGKSRKAVGRKRRLNKEANSSLISNKKFPCKVCNKLFDVALALARHVRAEHPPRRRGRPSKVIETPKPTTSEPRISMERGTEKTKTEEYGCREKSTKRSLGRSWNVKKLHCNDCGKWFSSAAHLATHCLQHATKKSDQVARRCMFCKKIIKSRLLYMQHIKIHKTKRSAKASSQSPAKTPKVKSRLRQVTNKITPLRKRRSSRKLRSSV